MGIFWKFGMSVTKACTIVQEERLIDVCSGPSFEKVKI